MKSSGLRANPSAARAVPAGRRGGCRREMTSASEPGGLLPQWSHPYCSGTSVTVVVNSCGGKGRRLWRR